MTNETFKHRLQRETITTLKRATVQGAKSRTLPANVIDLNLERIKRRLKKFTE